MVYARFRALCQCALGGRGGMPVLTHAPQLARATSTAQKAPRGRGRSIGFAMTENMEALPRSTGGEGGIPGEQGHGGPSCSLLHPACERATIKKSRRWR